MTRLEAENAALQQRLAVALETIARQETRIAELEARLAQDSHNSSRPPASDGLGRRLRRGRRASGMPSGGQAGHRGHTLRLVEPREAFVSLCGMRKTQERIEYTLRTGKPLRN